MTPQQIEAVTNIGLMAIYTVGAICWAYTLRRCERRWTRLICAGCIAVMVLCAFGRGIKAGKAEYAATQEKTQ